MFDCARDLRIGSVAAEVDVEGILPGTTCDWTRLELRQIDVAQGERGECSKERAGRVRRAEQNGRLHQH